jgi:hypothetical protein
MVIKTTLNRKWVLFLLIGGFYMTPRKSMAKRVAPPELPSITHEGVSYSAVYVGVGRDEPVCTVNAVDAKSGEQIWKTDLYHVRYDKFKETDVQDVWPRSMSIDGDDLRIENEKSQTFWLNLRTGRHTDRKGSP